MSVRPLLALQVFSLLAPALSVISPVLAQESLPISNLGASSALINEDWLVYSVFESFLSEDLNGDGDREDAVVHVEKRSTGETTNLGLAGPSSGVSLGFAVSGNWLVFGVSETQQREDLNGDGDREDYSVVHVHKLSTGETTNLRLAGGGRALGDWFVLWASESQQGEDLNGDGDTEDDVVHLVDLIALVSSRVFVRGDCDGDGFVGGTTGDIIFYLSWALAGSKVPGCLAACDTDGDGFVGGSVNDAVYYANWAFLEQNAPPSPFPECGPGNAEDLELGCVNSAVCP